MGFVGEAGLDGAPTGWKVLQRIRFLGLWSRGFVYCLELRYFDALETATPPPGHIHLQGTSVHSGAVPAVGHVPSSCANRCGLSFTDFSPFLERKKVPFVKTMFLVFFFLHSSPL